MAKTSSAATSRDAAAVEAHRALPAAAAISLRAIAATSALVVAAAPRLRREEAEAARHSRNVLTICLESTQSFPSMYTIGDVPSGSATPARDTIATKKALCLIIPRLGLPLAGERRFCVARRGAYSA